MLLSPAPAPPEGQGWAHEAKLDGWRCLAEVTGGQLRLWSRGGRDWTDRVPELQPLSDVGDIVLDGELVVATSDGRADFELLGARMQDRRPHPSPQVNLYVFDVLRLRNEELVDRPWETRRTVLDGLDLAARTAGAARPTVWSTDGTAMHQATAAIGAEGTVSKRRRSPYRAGRSRAWLKAKHKITETLAVAGWRPSTSSRPGGLILAEDGEPIGVATLALPDQQRRALVELIERYGRRHPTGTVTIPENSISATVHYSCRTPTHGHLREAFAVAVHPVAGADEMPPRTEILT
jgi:bifunctional non-homologous end joining protein LigD